MTLKSFTNEQEDLIRNFCAEWTQNNATDPGLFPLEMEAGEWEEQFALWKIDK